MRMMLENVSPSCIVFLLITIGCVIGKIKICKISVGLGGVLLVSVIWGFLLADFTASGVFESQMSFLSSLGSALFVSAIGLAAGSSVKLKNKLAWRAAAVGFCAVFITFAVMLIIIKVNARLSPSEMLGIFCGALTTTPTLSAACELECAVVQDVVVGYSCGYLPGVFLALAACSAFATSKEEKAFAEKQTSKGHNFSIATLLMEIGAVVLLGNLVSEIMIFEVVNPLGKTGGILICGIVVGKALQKAFPQHVLSDKMQSQIRVLGLALFFVGVGVPAGAKLACGIRIESFLYAVLLSFVAVSSAFLLARLFYPRDRKKVSSLIAGSMTSTPCCVFLEEDNKCFDAGAYSLAYISALLGAVLLVRLFSHVWIF